jgi:hypothetical protein
MIQMIKKKFQIKLNQMKNMILKKMKKNFPNLLKNKLRYIEKLKKNKKLKKSIKKKLKNLILRKFKNQSN